MEIFFREPYATPRNKQTKGYFLLLTITPGFQQIFDADLKEAGVLLAGHVAGIQRGPGGWAGSRGRSRYPREVPVTG